MCESVFLLRLGAVACLAWTTGQSSARFCFVLFLFVFSVVWVNGVCVFFRLFGSYPLAGTRLSVAAPNTLYKSEKCIAIRPRGTGPPMRQ